MASPTRSRIAHDPDIEPRGTGSDRSEWYQPQDLAKRASMRRAVELTIVAAVVAGLVAIAIGAEPYGRIDGEKVPPLAVSVATPERLPSYSVTRQFVGIVEARRQSHVGFERGGEIAEILVDEGDSVEAGAVLGRLDTSILLAERATRIHARDHARASLELAEITRRRVFAMHTHAVASTQEWDEADTDYEARTAALARAESAVAEIDTHIARSRLVAPYPAVVARRLVDEGEVVDAGMRVLHLIERVEPEVRVGIAGDAIEAISVGDRYELRVRKRRVPATVRAILPVRGNGTRSVDVILVLRTELDGIRQGDLATLSLEREEAEPGFWLPLSALTESSRGLWACYVVVELGDEERSGSATHTLRRRELEVVHQEADRVFVRGTLSEGESVVTEGLQRLVPGQWVRIAAADVLTAMKEES